MAEEQDDIIILEEGEETTDEESSTNAEEEVPKRSKKNIIIIVSLALLLIVVVVILAVVLKKSSNNRENINIKKLTKKIIKKESSLKFPSLKLDHLIKKANLLYKKGDKQEALKLYEEIATYNESISNYNIGVAKMKEKKYLEAIKYFKKAIQNRQNRCISAINSAVCALRLDDEKLFKYYISLADIYLPYEANAPLYTYYMALIKYYKGEYFESLIPLRHPSSKYYKENQNYLLAKIDTFFGDYFQAINHLEKNRDLQDDFTLGLLYAKIGEYAIAIKHFLKSYQMKIEPTKSKIAMALSYINLGLLDSAAKNLNQANLNYKKNILDIYPIKVEIKPSLTSLKLSQNEFEKKVLKKRENVYGLLFYFAPYKVFNAKQTIEFIRKGGVGLSLNQTKSALLLLSQSSNISKVNKMMTKGIEKALQYKITEANAIFKSLKDRYPNHAILFYNLALTYAQMGDYTNAYKNFIKSYHLNSKNYLSGIFAIMTKELIHQDNTKLTEEVLNDLNSDHKAKERKFYYALIDFTKNSYTSALNFAEMDNSNKPLHLIFDAIVAKNLNSRKLFIEKSLALKTKLPKDMIAELLYDSAKTYGKSIENFAKEVQKSFLKKDTNLRSLFYGPVVAREIYIDTLHIAGMLYYIRDILEQQLQNEDDDVVGIMQALGYIDIYTANYEEAYAIYNELIDTYKQNDTNTLFLAAVASIGAKHNANAIALLELAKLTDPNNFESRLALGLLYMEVKNLEGAKIQFAKIGDSNFISKYFTFKIKSKEK